MKPGDKVKVKRNGVSASKWDEHAKDFVPLEPGDIITVFSIELNGVHYKVQSPDGMITNFVIPIDHVELVAQTASKHKCHCPRHVWLNQGCQCGGI